jgi:NTE family protein
MPGTGIVFAGAAALGAYEAGVMAAIAEELGAGPGRPRIDVLCGTSAGAINACAMACGADAPAAAAARLCATWQSVRIGALLRPSAVELLSMLLATGGVHRAARELRARTAARGGLLDPEPIERLFARALPVRRLAAQLRAGHLRSVAVSATQVATGRSVVFYQSAAPAAPWPTDPLVVPSPARLTLRHALASAAIPLLFPPVAIDGDLYCDGGLRQIVPLSPALHLGADRLIVINPLGGARRQDAAAQQARRDDVASPIYLAGKAVGALFADRLDADLGRMQQVNAVLRAGTARYGATFPAELNRELARGGAAPLRCVGVLRIEPSEDVTEIAAEHVASPAFARRERSAAGRLLRCLGGVDPAHAADLLAYLLFDGGFAAELIELGRTDVRARRDELRALLAPAAATAPAARSA